MNIPDSPKRLNPSGRPGSAFLSWFLFGLLFALFVNSSRASVDLLFRDRHNTLRQFTEPRELISWSSFGFFGHQILISTVAIIAKDEASTIERVTRHLSTKFSRVCFPENVLVNQFPDPEHTYVSVLDFVDLRLLDDFRARL